jgi:hypothetical protein
VVSNVDVGYTVSVEADGYLRVSTSTYIMDVADGAVTAGSEEYGGESIGTYATSTGSDFAFASSTERDVQTSTTFGDHDRSGILYKLAVSPATPSGYFTQVLYYRLTINY